MNHIAKASKHQERSVLKNIRKKGSNYIQRLLTQTELIDTIEAEMPQYRERLYTPIRTLSMFVLQALHSDRSCQRAVNDTALELSNCSVATGAYCRARQRLPESMISKLVKAAAQENEHKVRGSWQWRGRSIYLVDGTTLAMPDTPANQKVYPQPSFHSEGLGFLKFRGQHTNLKFRGQHTN